MSDAKRFKATPPSSDYSVPSTRKMDRATSSLPTSSSPPLRQLQPSSSSKKMSNSDKALLKVFVKQRVRLRKDYCLFLEKCLTLINLGPSSSDDSRIEAELRELTQETLLHAFETKADAVAAHGNTEKTNSALTETSIEYLRKQEEVNRLEITQDPKFLSFLDSFFSALVDEVLSTYCDEKKAQQKRMVSIEYYISETKLSHTSDVDEFVLRAVKVSKWFESAESYCEDASNYEDAPYFCVIQSSGMGKTKIFYEGCKQLQETKNDWFCFTILPETLKGSGELTNGNVFSHKLNLENTLTEKTARDAARSVIQTLDGFYKKLLNAANVTNDNSGKIVFLCFDEAQVYLKPKSFNDDSVEHPAFIFRCIRLWLRKKGRQHKVIACFTGTNATLASSRLETDPDVAPIGNFRFYEKGKRVFPIFLQTTTMGCLDGHHLGGKKQDDGDTTTEYHRAVRYGRPLFQVMEANGDLTRCEFVVIRRMLLYSIGTNWTRTGEESLQACLSILGTRVQMGQTSFSIASNMVAYGYANLIHATSTDAVICFMSDPVCGRLAMRLMDKNWALGEIKGRDTSFWLKKMKDIFVQGLCRPEKGNFGEVMVALYFLVCADSLRQDPDLDYTFSVSLADWIDKLLNGGLDNEGQSTRSPVEEDTITNSLPTRKSRRLLAKAQATAKIEAEDTGEAEPYNVTATVSFIQVCRSYLRSYEVDWEGLCSQGFLSYMYRSGTAFYVYPGCPIIDLVIPIRLIVAKGKKYFAPMVISIKSHGYISPADARAECNRMAGRFDELRQENADAFPGALCLLVLFGSTSVSSDHDLSLTPSVVGELAQKKVVSKVLRIPSEDSFGGFCNVFTTLKSEMNKMAASEVFASHSFVRAYCKDKDTEELHKSVALRPSARDAEVELLENLQEQFQDA